MPFFCAPIRITNSYLPGPWCWLGDNKLAPLVYPAIRQTAYMQNSTTGGRELGNARKAMVCPPMPNNDSSPTES